MSPVSRSPQPLGLRALPVVLALAVAYILAARLGLLMASLHGAVSPVWPASGLAIGALVVGGRRLWPAVLLGAWIANLGGVISWWGAGCIAVGNVGEAWLGAWIIERVQRGRAAHALFWEAIGVVGAALAAPLISAGTGVATLTLASTLSEVGLIPVVGTWWIGDAIGTLALTPLILSCARMRGASRSAWLRVGLAALAATAVALPVFLLPKGGTLLFAVFPVLLWAAWWSGETGVKLSAVAVSVVGIAASWLGHGPFLGSSLNDTLLFLELFLGSVGIAALVLPVFAAAGSLLVAGLFLLAGWSASGWVFARIHRERLAADHARFEALTADAERTVRQRMATYLEGLRAGAALHAASTDVTRVDWTRFVSTLDLRRRLPGIRGLGVVRRVPEHELADYLALRRLDDAPDFAVQTFSDAPPPGGERYLLSFFEPDAPSRSRAGLDLGSETRRRQAADEARDAGEPRASARVEVADDPVTRVGFLVFHPIYAVGRPLDSVAHRREAIRGWVVAAFVAEDFFGAMFVSPELEMSVFDGRSIEVGSLLHTSTQASSRRAGYAKTTAVELAGTMHTLAWNRSASFAVASPMPSVLTASSLALVTLLLAGLGVNLQSTGRRAREIAAARTEELTAAQATLAGINRLHRAVLDGTSYSIIATDDDGTIRIFNRGAEQMLGFMRDEVIGKHSPAIIHLPEEMQARAAELAAELGRPVEPGFEVFVARARAGEVDQREWTYVRKNGTRVPVLLSVSALRNAEGVVTGFLGIAYDLTERRALEQSLRLEQSRLRLANEAAGTAVWEWDVVTGQLTWDAAMFALYGLPPAAGGRVTYDDWRYCVHPDDLVAQERALQATLRDGGRGQREFRIVRRGDEEVRHISASDLAIPGPDGRTARVVGINRDVTEQRRALEQLRQSQARLASIFGAVREGLVLLDADGSILECNAAACSILGVARDELGGRLTTHDGWDTVRQDGTPYPPSQHPTEVTLTTGLAVRDAVMGLRRPGRAELWVSINTVPIRGPGEGVQAVVVSLSDVSAQQQIARDLARARDEAVEASRLKSEFLATMSHEIRTPMNGVIGTVDLLLGTPLDATQHEMARLIQGSAESLLEIINDILDFSRIEAGKFRINPEPFSVLPLLEETVALLATRAQRKGLEFVLEVDPAIAAEVLIGDAGRIRQVLVNIIGNAVKFTERGEIVVSAGVTPGRAGTGVLRVVVRDTGIGIPAEARDRLFHAFTQVDSSVTRRYGGTGLGLAISRQLVDLMGGRLDFISEAGRGSEFWVELELGRQSGASLARDAVGLEAWVVEDNDSARRALVRLLEGLGARVAAVENAEEALALLAATAVSPDRERVLLVDRDLPGTDGLALVRRARAVPGAGDLPVVLLVLPGDAGLPLDGVGARIAVVTKPVRLDQLRLALGKARLGRPAPAAASDRLAETAPAGPARPRLRVLVAEDNPANQLVARMVLENLGHRVDIAESGRAALERLAEARYDVVLMDCQMPDIDGYEATRRIRRGEVPGIDPAQIVVALTAFAMESDRGKCLAAGMNDYVSKPVRAAEMDAVLARCRAGAGNSAASSSALAGGGERMLAGAPPPAIAAEPLIDETFQAGLRELPGLRGPSLLTEVIELYQREAVVRMSDMADLLARGDLEGVLRVAHTLAGSSANAGAPRARAAFAAIEQAVRTATAAVVSERVASARDVWHELVRELARRGFPCSP